MQPIPHGIGKARQFDAMRPHGSDAAKLKAFGKVKNGPALHQRGEGRVGRQFGRLGCKGVRDPGGRDFAADDALAGVGLQPIDAGRLVREPLPDRQKQACDHSWIVLSVNSGTSASSARQAAAKLSRSVSTQWLSSISFKGMLCCSIGRISRTRRSISPSSSMKLGAGV